MADAKPPFIPTSGSTGGSGPGVLTRDRAQQSGAPEYNKDSVPDGGRSAIPKKGQYNDSSTGKPFKNLSDGEVGGDGDVGAVADMDE